LTPSYWAIYSPKVDLGAFSVTDLPERIGKYEVIALLGKGAMGAVYEARDPVLDRVVALKTMSEALLIEEEMRERFYREARSAAKLQHVNIVTIYELGEVDGRPFIAMELLDGQSLAELMKEGQLPHLHDKIALVLQVCNGLHFAHRHGVIHRDVKPSNIQILPDGTVKIMDFGIALQQGGTMMTRTGVVLGTPNYMAPEQITGTAVDHRADMWSVAVILYELLADKLPFDADTLPSLIYCIVHKAPPPLEAEKLGVPPGIAEIVDRVLHKEPSERYEDLVELASALRSVPGAVGPTQAVAGKAQDRTVILGPEDTASSMPAAPPSEGTAPADSPAVDIASTMDEVDSAIGAGQREKALRLLEEVLAVKPDFARAVDLRDMLKQQVTTPPVPAPATRVEPTEPLSLPSSFREVGTFGEAVETKIIAIAPGEKLLAIGGVDGSVRLWDIAGRTKLEILRSSMHQRAGHEGLVTSLAFSPDGALLAAGHVDGAIHVWDIDRREELQVRLGHERAAIGAVAFSPDGQILASGGLDSTVKLWERSGLEEGEARRRLTRQPAGVTSLAWVHEGEQLVTGHVNRLIRVHEASTGKLSATLRGHGSGISVLCVGPDDNLLISGGQDQTLRLFDVERSNPVGVLKGHERAVSSIAPFPEGRRAVSAAMENRLIVWDLAEERPLTTLWGAGNESFVSLRVFNEGRAIASALNDGSIRLWAAE
jgi:tRNA A-37 threonylcarbamoyl transferase component Bud32